MGKKDWEGKMVGGGCSQDIKQIDEKSEKRMVPPYKDFLIDQH